MTLFSRPFMNIVPLSVVVTFALGQTCWGVVPSDAPSEVSSPQDSAFIIPALPMDQNTSTVQEKSISPCQPAERLWSIDLKALSDTSFLQSIREDKLSPFLNYDLFSTELTSSVLLYSRDVYSEITKGEYLQAAQKAALELSRLVEENAPWKIDGYKEGGRAAFNNLLLLQAHSLEMAGRWDEALGVYEALYGFNQKLEPENLEWVWLRRSYAREEAQEMASSFCRILSRYDLSVEKVESVIESGKILREKANANPDEMWSMRLPIGETENGELDFEAYRVYALRDQCARVVYPKLHYAVPVTDNLRGAKIAQLTRLAFDKFVEVIEKDLESYLENPEAYRGKVFSYVKISQEKEVLIAKQTIEILRKMKELPF